MSAQNVVKIGPAYQRTQSPLMQLPQELRNYIYAFLFSSTRFTSGERNSTHYGAQSIAPARHGLAILLSCRQAYTEIGKAWLRHVLFCFESPQAILDKLSKIPLETRSAIRHIRVTGEPMWIYIDDGQSYCISQVFKFLPGLKLDILTVLGAASAEDSYDVLDLLVKCGDGWKELHYISQTSAFIGYAQPWLDWDPDQPKDLDLDRWYRKPQPSAWQRNLEDRDGSNSGASVTIYRSTIPHSAGSVMQAATRAKFTQVLPPGQGLKQFNEEKDPQLMAPGECEKEMLVVVKRGRGVDYEEKQGSPNHLHTDLRSEYPGQSWMEIMADLDRFFAWYNRPVDDDEGDDYDLLDS